MAISRAEKEFFSKLEKTPRKWQLFCDGAIRFGDHGYLTCPIIAVAGNGSNTMAISIGSEVLKLSAKRSTAIVEAADNPATKHQALRKKLLKACGLSEVLK